MDKHAGRVKEEQQKLLYIINDKENSIKKLISIACDEKIRDANQASQIAGKVENTKGSSSSPYHIFADDTYHPMPYTHYKILNVL